MFFQTWQWTGGQPQEASVFDTMRKLHWREWRVKKQIWEDEQHKEVIEAFKFVKDLRLDIFLGAPLQGVFTELEYIQKEELKAFLVKIPKRPIPAPIRLLTKPTPLRFVKEHRAPPKVVVQEIEHLLDDDIRTIPERPPIKPITHAVESTSSSVSDEDTSHPTTATTDAVTPPTRTVEEMVIGIENIEQGGYGERDTEGGMTLDWETEEVATVREHIGPKMALSTVGIGSGSTPQGG
jgi:hypothetical protein